ncbi:hypothetical protein BC830DRAFT_1076970 [Chytriomyces sp. MP71]|nr:hypothetical protein BC830DRAFT_1076970 [Chytriomyces sp. MP71]
MDSQIDEIPPQTASDSDGETNAIEVLITSIKPLLPKISNHIRNASSKSQLVLHKETKDDLLSMLDDDAPPPVTVAAASSSKPTQHFDHDANQSNRSLTRAKSITSQGNLLVVQPTDEPSLRRKSLREYFMPKTTSTSSLVPAAPSKVQNASSVPAIAPNTSAPAPTLASQPLSDDTLALALASLCNALYRVLDSFDSVGPTPSAVQTASSLSHSFTAVQSLLNTTNISHEQRVLWVEVDKLMALVQTICVTRCEVEERPPSYSSIPRVNSFVNTDELHKVANAIDRVVQMAPKLFNQCVTLNARQERMMDEAALTRLIDRLFVGREDFQAQRASPDSYLNMSRLVDQIVKSSKRSMDNQRVMPSESYQNKIESAKLMNVIEKQAKTRFRNQDWVNKEMQLISDLALLQTNLMNACRGMGNQRVELTEAKEKELFIGQLLGKMNKKTDQTFDNQTAISITKKKRDDDLDDLFDKITKTSSQLNTQRY